MALFVNNHMGVLPVITIWMFDWLADINAASSCEGNRSDRGRSISVNITVLYSNDAYGYFYYFSRS